MNTTTQSRSFWADNLRSFITLLVVAHHAALAYNTFSTFNKQAYILSTHPVVDKHRWMVLDLFVSFNDSYFMPLMFLISGLFTVGALKKKGVQVFIRDRFYRLFIPFMVAVTLLMLAAYYPAYLLSDKPPGFRNYIVDFFTVEGWPVGPPWFIWVLFMFNLVLGIFHRLIVPLLTQAANQLVTWSDRPFPLFLSLLLVSWILYVPAAYLFGAYEWTGIGPFDFQTSRLLLYFGYFLAGSIMGIADFNNTLLAADAPLVKRWRLWIAGSIISYLLLLITSAWTYSLQPVVHSTCLVLIMTFACMASLSLFRRFGASGSPVWRSLSANAYGIYLLHFVFVVWCQYLLLTLNIPAAAKFAITFIVAAACSWLVMILLRKIPLVRDYV